MSAEIDIRLVRRLGSFHLDLEWQAMIQGVTCIFGPSGSGKTTLLRLLAGLDRPDKGSIHWCGEPWFDRSSYIPAHRRPVGYVFQEARLFAHMTVRQNLDFAHRRCLKPRDGQKVDQQAVIETLDIAGLLDRDITGLSGGEIQRVAIARTLMRQPQLLLMDEPMAALDRQRKAEILPFLHKLAGQFAIPTLYVTHAIEEVAQLADQMVVLDNGQLMAQGETARVMERMDIQPLTGKFEAGVLVTGVVARHDEADELTYVSLGDTHISMPRAAHLGIGTSVRLRIRARDVALATEKPNHISIRNVLSAQILEIVEDQKGSFAEVLLQANGCHIRARITRAALKALALAPGRDVYALIKTVSFDRRLL